MDFNPKRLRKRFAELTDKRTAIEAVLAPLHRELEELRGDYRRREQELVDKIKTARAPMVEIDQERSAIAGALKGKVGDPADDEAETKPVLN